MTCRTVPNESEIVRLRSSVSVRASRRQPGQIVVTRRVR